MEGRGKHATEVLVPKLVRLERKANGTKVTWMHLAIALYVDPEINQIALGATLLRDRIPVNSISAEGFPVGR